MVGIDLPHRIWGVALAEFTGGARQNWSDNLDEMAYPVDDDMEPTRPDY
ncbi:hypothetical protein KA068_01425 [Candidatus Saccharibacteria bacterium]|nr:hypothetical protein [Candidatus Saccharibacteria bacterium]